MNAERLLQLFDCVSEAPDAIPRLRRFILDLAVRGKLVEQDSSDEPAQSLVREIVSSRRRSENSKKAGPELNPLDGPFALPASWIWVGATFPASSISDHGKKVKTKDVLEAGVYPVVDQGKVLVRGYCNHPDKVIRVESPIIVFGDHTRETKLIDFDFVVGADGVKLLQPVGVDPRYYYLALTWLPLEARGYGRHFKLLRESRIPLPPLAEQHRIVAKVDELMALCDSLDAEREKRESSRDRLTTASLSRLTAPDVDENQFKAHAIFAIKVLPELTTRPDQIKALRQTILDLAVRGKLVEQDPNDEPALDAVGRIGKLPVPARYAKRSPELIPGHCGLSINRPDTELPRGWAWIPLVDIARIESGHTPSRSRPDWWDGDIPWMGLVDARMNDNGRIFDTIQHTNEAGLANSAARLLPEGTVCFSRTASVGYVVVLGRPMATSQDFVNWVPSGAVSSEWLQLVLVAERPSIPRFTKGAVHQTIYYPAWLSMHIALPPLSEQQRIVSKVRELEACCDRISDRLNAAQYGRGQVLVAILSETLKPMARRVAQGCLANE